MVEITEKDFQEISVMPLNICTERKEMYSHEYRLSE